MQVGIGSPRMDTKWSTRCRALYKLEVISTAYPTAPCHRSVTRTTTILLTGRASSTPICDSYNYRFSDKTCQLNTDLWLVQLPSYWQDVPAQHRSVTRTTTVLQTRRDSSSKRQWMFQTTLKSTVLAPAWYSFNPFTIHRRVCTERNTVLIVLVCYLSRVGVSTTVLTGDIDIEILPVCLYVCLSRSWIIPKRLNVMFFSIW